MSATIKKPPPPSPIGRRPSTNPSPSSSLNSRGPSPTTPLTTNGLGRTRSVRGSNGTPASARAAAKRPGAGMSNLSNGNSVSLASDDPNEDDARAETVALIDELKSSLHKAETASEEYQRQLSVLQTRLEDALNEQGKLEEHLHECNDRVVALETEKRDSVRRMREMEGLFVSERAAMMKEREEQELRGEEMQSAIQRLKETLAQKDLRLNLEGDGGLSRSSSIRSRASPDIDNGHFAPPSSVQRSDSQNNSKLVMQKDRIIEGLRLELAEAQIKVVEMENTGSGRLHDLEKSLLETRITNARLMEDNESFQLLLGEKTLNGDFSKADSMPGSNNAETANMGSLADELKSATEGENDGDRRAEAEIKSLKDQNKALTLYIESIISRLLQHKDFESLLDKTPDLMAGPKPAADTEKELPPPPPKPEQNPPSILQRAVSVVAGPARPKPRPRPMSQMPAPSAPGNVIMSPNEDPSTAPRIPLGRSQSSRGSRGGLGHRRVNSEMPNAFSVVNHMYRGPPAGNAASGISPGISPGMSTPRTSFFAPTFPGTNNNSSSNNNYNNNNTNNSNPTTAARIPSGPHSLAPTESQRASSSSNSVLSDHSNNNSNRDSTSVDTPSPPRSTGTGAGASSSTTNYTGAVMTQSKLRPLRLVQENRELELGGGEAGRMVSRTGTGLGMGLDGESGEGGEVVAGRKKGVGNRASWMGWFNKGKEEEAPVLVGRGGRDEGGR